MAQDSTEAPEAQRTHVVTGASGFTGRYISSMLLSQGETVRTITNYPSAQWDPRIQPFPMDFQDPEALARALGGADTLFNTYWIRFARGEMDFGRAVENSKLLVDAALRAGVKRIVHVSITNADRDSRYPYFRGKGLVEEAVRDSGISHAILRPAFVFGPGDVLLNNVAWLLRKSPVFVIPGDGRYRMRPVFATDMAGTAVDLAGETGNVTLDMLGPETLSMNEVVEMVRRAVGSRARGRARARRSGAADGPHGGSGARGRDSHTGRDRRPEGRTAGVGGSGNGGDRAQRVAGAPHGQEIPGRTVRVRAGKALPERREIMMFGLKCEKCGETIGPMERELTYDRSPTEHGARLWHFKCAGYDTPMTTEKRADWNTWKLQQLDETSRKELDDLRGRTQALRGVVIDLMRKADCSEEHINNFDYEYRFREERG